ncbi:MAG: trypsin-like peptidase domain-containing protein [Betaproteobacteria bacterium]|nr:trypsin-like peptidase domain-containing protein [Betaproteobacteria bacterium]
MWRRTWLVFSQAVTVAVALLFVVLTLKPEWLQRDRLVASPLPPATLVQAAPPTGSASGAASGAAKGADGGYASAARVAAPAVVSVTATRTAQRHPQADDPRLRFFFGDGGATQRRVGLGSGVIVAPEGYLLTNHHVVDQATEIEVQLTDGRQVQARWVGSDPETDIAVLKIELDALPVLALGDVRALQVGDAVLAIGNPFNVGQTVTAGIVSALGRKQDGSSPFQNFIQTDAAINPGNSGGALVNADGQLVGINTAIYSRTGGSMGIGFAVPVDTARQVMEILVRGGSVRRGWIGVETRDLSAELVEALKLPVSTGVLIAGVQQGGPAARGGVRPGDVVVRVGDTAVADSGELLAAVAALPPQSASTLAVQRGAQTLELPVVVAERPPLRRQGDR